MSQAQLKTVKETS